MKYRSMFERGFVLISTISILSACSALPTPTSFVPAPTSISAPNQPVVRAPATPAQPTEAPVIITNTPPTAGGESTANPNGSTTANETTTVTAEEGTKTMTVVPTKANPADLPFLMQVDRISVVVGRGVLLQGRVTNGSLQANTIVDILGPQDQLLGVRVLAVLISNVVQEQVKVGDYAGVLVETVNTTDLSPGMLATEADGYKSYDDALKALQ